MFLNKTISIFTFFLLSTATILMSELTVQQVKIFDTTWTNPSDGSFPILTEWKMKIILEDQNEFWTTSRDNAYTDVHTRIKEGDTVLITKETYIYNQPEQSWFHVRNLSNGNEFDFIGKAFQTKPEITSYKTEDVFNIRDLLIKKINDKWFLSFYVKNIHTTVEIPSDKYHDYYEGMPLIFLNQEKQEFAENNKYRLHLRFFHPILQQDITVVSDVMDGPLELMIINSESFGYTFHEVRNPNGSGPSSRTPYLQTWTTKLVLEDGQELILNGHAGYELRYQNKWGGFREPTSSEVDVSTWYKAGDRILITNESESQDINQRKNNIGDFTIINLNNKRTHTLQGILRYSSVFVFPST